MSANVVSLVVAQCETHVRRMLWAKRALQAGLPLNTDRLRGLDDAQVAIVDQFVGRFAILYRSHAPRGNAAVDALRPVLLAMVHTLSGCGAFKAAFPCGAWERSVRNAFAHDYPEDSELQAAILNRAFSAADRLVEILLHAKRFAARYVHE